MANKIPSNARGGTRSKKRTGVITQSIRISAADKSLLRRAAKAESRSFNGWAIFVLMREANRVVKAAAAKKIPGDGPTAKAMRAASRGETK